MKTIITKKGESEDMEVHIRRVGRRVIISTERPGVARAIERQLIESMTQQDQKPAIGFHIEE